MNNALASTEERCDIELICEVYDVAEEQVVNLGHQHYEIIPIDYIPPNESVESILKQVNKIKHILKYALDVVATNSEELSRLVSSESVSAQDIKKAMLEVDIDFDVWIIDNILSDAPFARYKVYKDLFDNKVIQPTNRETIEIKIYSEEAVRIITEENCIEYLNAQLNKFFEQYESEMPLGMVDVFDTEAYFDYVLSCLDISDWRPDDIVYAGQDAEGCDVYFREL